MNICGECGHDLDAHPRGPCREAIPYALGISPCTCPKFVPLGVLIGVAEAGR